MAYEIVGHRGYSAVAPENTLASIRRAVEAGADAVEWDVHVASCGTPVLFHDTNLGRTTNGVGPIRRRTLGQLRVLDAGSWFSDDFEGEPIPSLAEALDEVRGRIGRVYPEVKGYRELEDLDRMVDIVRRADMLGDTVFISADWGTVERIAGRDPAVHIGYIVDEAGRFPEALERALDRGRAFLDFDARLLLADPSMAERTRRAEVDVGAWTVNEPDDASTLASAGVTRFTTDRVERLLEWRARS